MNVNESRRDKVGAGKSIVNRHEKFYHRGSLMFIEGESSTEMFIIRSGCVRILKQEGENTIELAQLGPGSVLGELSLLDHQPRSATAQVLEDTSVTVIDEELFTRTLNNIPNWLENIIKLVVKRLRDTMKKTGDDIVIKSIGGVIQILLLLSESVAEKTSEQKELLVSIVKEQVLAIVGLGGVELENIFLHLILKEFIVIKKNNAGQEFITITDHGKLRLYMQYLRIHQRGGSLIGEEFTNTTFDLIEALIEAGEKNGVKTASKLLSVTEQQIEIALARQGKQRHIDRDALEQLTESKLLLPGEKNTESKYGHHTLATYSFNPDLLKNVIALKQWLPVFKEEIKF